MNSSSGIPEDFARTPRTRSGIRRPNDLDRRKFPFDEEERLSSDGEYSSASSIWEWIDLPHVDDGCWIFVSDFSYAFVLGNICHVGNNENAKAGDKDREK